MSWCDSDSKEPVLGTLVQNYDDAPSARWRGGLFVIDMTAPRIVVFARAANFYQSNGKLLNRNSIGAFAPSRPQSPPPLATAIGALAENEVRLSPGHGAEPLNTPASGATLEALDDACEHATGVNSQIAA
jgi:hypothetical protein